MSDPIVVKVHPRSTQIYMIVENLEHKGYYQVRVVISHAGGLSEPSEVNVPFEIFYDLCSQMRLRKKKVKDILLDGFEIDYEFMNHNESITLLETKRNNTINIDIKSKMIKFVRSDCKKNYYPEFTIKDLENIQALLRRLDDEYKMKEMDQVIDNKEWSMNKIQSVQDFRVFLKRIREGYRRNL